MSYDSKRLFEATLKGDLPSYIFNNLTASTKFLAYAHRDVVQILDLRILNGLATATCHPVEMDGASSGLTHLNWCRFDGASFLVVCTRTDFSIYSDMLERLECFNLSSVGAATPRSYFCGSASVPSKGLLLVGTSWGEILHANHVGTSFSTKAGSKSCGHTHPITCIAASDECVVSGDGEGTVIQWDWSSLSKPLKIHKGGGFPCSALVVQEGLIIAGYTSGHVRCFTHSHSSERCGLLVEIAAHTRAVTSLATHPHQITVSCTHACTAPVWVERMSGIFPGVWCPDVTALCYVGKRCL